MSVHSYEEIMAEVATLASADLTLMDGLKQR